MTTNVLNLFYLNNKKYYNNMSAESEVNRQLQGQGGLREKVFIWMSVN